jgi:hypothetical protein
LEIVPYSSELLEPLERLNAKLLTGGSEWTFPLKEVGCVGDAAAVWSQRFLAVEDGEVYGGYRLKHQAFFLDGRATEVGNLQIPVSLGVVDRRAAHVGIRLVFDAVKRSPLLYCLGLGSLEEPLAKMLSAARWQHLAVPFYFSIKSPRRFAENIRLSGRPGLERALRLTGRLRIAGPALRLRSSLRRRSSQSARPTFDDAHVRADLHDVADPLFDAHRATFSFIADRRAAALVCLYPEDDARYVRLVVEEGREPVGWAVLLDTSMRDHKYFGDMRVGTLADCFAATGDTERVVAAADDCLARRGVDLVVSNQLHPSWCAALEAAGYEQGPSNFFFFFSPALAERLTTVADWHDRIHLNRGDGDGPINL